MPYRGHLRRFVQIGCCSGLWGGWASRFGTLGSERQSEYILELVVHAASLMLKSQTLAGRIRRRLSLNPPI